MSQDNAKKQRGWLPEKKLRESISGGNIIALVIAFLFTIMFICVDFIAESENVELIAGIGGTLSSIALGFYLSNCLGGLEEKWKRMRAIEIDNHVSKEIMRAEEEFRGTSNSLSILSTTDNPESYRMSLYFLIQRRIDVRKFITDKASEIGELGYDSEAFMAEKEENFKRMQQLADKLLKSISESSSLKSLKPLIETLEVPLQLDDHDRIESHVVSSSETTEGETQEAKPESETV